MPADLEARPDSGTASRGIAACAAVVAVVFLWSLVGIRYVTNDDIWLGLWTFEGLSVQAGYSLAEQHGRLFKPASMGIFVPYYVDHAAYYLVMYLGPIVAAALLAARLLRQVVPVAGTAALFVLLFFALAQNSGHTSLFSAVPFSWEMTWVTLLAGAWALVRAIETRRMAIAVAGSFVYLIGMVEGFVPHIALLALIAIWAPGGWRRNLRFFLPYAAAFALWMVAWIIWRMQHPPQYEGAALVAEPSLWRLLKTIAVFAFGGAPFNTLVGDVVVADLRTFREGFGVAWCVKALAVGLGVFAWLRIAVRSRWHPGWRLSFALVALVILPVLLMSMTPKYQQWVDYGARGYVHSHYAYFAWIALLVVVLVSVSRWMASRVVAIVVAAVFAAGSVVTDWSNHEINLQQKLSALKWDTVDHALASRAFAQIPQGAVIVYDGLDRFRGIAVTDAHYWSRYFTMRTGRTFHVHADDGSIGNTREPGYRLVFRDAPRTEDQYILIGRQEPGDAAWQTVGFSVVASTRNDGAAILANVSCEQGCPRSALVDGTPRDIVAGNLVAPVQVPASGVVESSVAVEPSARVDLRSVWVVYERDALRIPVAVAAAPSAVDGIFTAKE